MKEFMVKLYSNQYFGIILFSIIGILALLFVIVLILAIRDAKKQKKIDNVMKEADEANKMADVAFAQENIAPVELSIPETENANETKETVVGIAETGDKFGELKVEPPKLDTETVNDNKNFPDLEITAPIQIDDSKKESVSINNDSSNGTENEELKNIALTLAKEYQKEHSNLENEIVTPVLKAQQPEQFSSIYVTPGAIPNKEDNQNKPTNMPNISTLPSPQPVKVVEQSKIFDSSTDKSEDIQGN